MKTRARANAEKIALSGILGAAALVLSFFESLLPPLPMVPPGFKLGLSNIVTMYAAGTVGLPCALFLAVIKGGFAFYLRGLAAGAMSLSGAVLSTVCVWLLLKTDTSFIMLGVCGALAHNFAQLCCAWLITGTAVVFYIPFVLIFGIATGTLTGTVLRFAMPALDRVRVNLE